MPLISCRNLQLSYENNKIIENLSFDIEEGDYLCIVGENGSGKSTLIKSIIGLKQVQQGEIIFSKDLKKNEIGYLPQQSAAQKDFPASVYEVVLSGCLNKRGLKPFYSIKDKKNAADNMEKLGISNIKKSCYRELSGGQQQRVLLARALCATGKLVLLDEPVTGLDPLAAKELYEIIDLINKEQKITVIMVSHDIKSAVEHAENVLHLSKEEVFYGNTEKYLNSNIGKRFIGKNK